MPKVLVAMSGGVDSSTTALLLKEQGYECVGATMRLCTEKLLGKPAESDDVEDARSVCAKLGIPFVELDCADEFESTVVRDFVESYLAGETPNPCIVCNRRLKFGALYEKARDLGCDFIATGHYARILRDGQGRPRLAKAIDPSKDQSYVLYSLTPEKLEHVLLPLGGMTKAQVRQIAEEHGLVTAHKSESEDICFVPDGSYLDFLGRYADVACEPGDIVDVDGRRIGTHKGAIAYTIGQRKGLGIGGLKEPYFVCGKDMPSNTVVAGPEIALFASELVARDWNWIAPGCEETFRASVRTRYHQQEQLAVLTPSPGNTMHVAFDQPQRGIAPGQAVVAYDGDLVVGGGTIC